MGVAQAPLFCDSEKLGYASDDGCSCKKDALTPLATSASRCTASTASTARRGSIDTEQRQREYWRKNLRVTAVLMAIGFVVTFVVAFFARELNFNFFGWPFSFWMAAQGALLVYVALVWFYARTMNRLDREYGFDEAREGERP